MHYELDITLNNDYFTVKVTYQIVFYLNQFNNTGEVWFDVRLSKTDISNLKKLAVSKEEKRFINKLKENESIDIIEHFYF
ncbi:hypothetical protein [Methanobrevibacter sp.]